MPGMTIEVPMSEAARRLSATITLTGTRRFNVRFRVGLALMRLAAFVLPFRADVEVRS